MSNIPAVSGPLLEVPLAAPKPSTRRLALYGTLWTVIGYGLANFLRLASNLILTRLLAPSIFGAMALVQVTILGLGMFSDIGVGPSVIRAKGDDPNFLNTAWTLQFLRGWALWLACLAIAEPVARFYHLPELRILIVITGLQAIIGGSQSMSMFTQNKKLALKSLTLLSLTAQVIGLIVMIVCAYYFRNIWSMVFGGLAGVSISTVGSYIFLPGIRPRFCWDKKAAHELFHFGKWIFISTIMTFMASQMDRVMLGKLVPLAVLGVYSVAMSLATLPNSVILHVASMILYPILAQHADDDRQQYIHKVLKARRLLLPIGVIIVTGLATVAQPFFHWLYDARYADAAWMAQLLSIYIWFWMLQASADRALIALGDTRSVSISNFVNLIVTLVGCLAGYRIAQMAGFIIGLSFSSLCGHVVIEIALYNHGINIFFQDIISTMLAAVLATTALLIGRGTGSLMSGYLQQPVQWLVPNLVIFAAGIWVMAHVKRVLTETDTTR